MKKETDIQILRNSMLLNLVKHCWTNRAKASNDKINTEETDDAGVVTNRKATRRVSATKQLIICEEYDAIVNHLTGVYGWVLNRSMLATGIGRGTNLVRRDMLEPITAYIENGRKVLREELVPALLAVYPQAKADAKRPVNDQQPESGGLGSLYCEGDYPTPEALADCFDIEYRIFALSVPDDTPDEIRERENKKLRKVFEEAQQECLYALRGGFASIVEHAIERLKVNAGERPKIFVADSMVGAFMDFFDTFRAKNLMDDEQLESVVDQAKEIVAQFAPNIQRVKNNTAERNHVADKLAVVKTTLDGLLKDRPSRRFQFDT
jgi:dGTP triphosphohydrolase